MNRQEAIKHLNKCIAADVGVTFSNHAKKQMALPERKISVDDVLNVLDASCKRVLDGEFENGSWRYRVRTDVFTVVIAFAEDGNSITIVTAIRN